MPDIRKMTDEELAVAIRNWTYNSISYPMAESIAPLIRLCVKDSTPKGLTVEEIEKIIWPDELECSRHGYKTIMGCPECGSAYAINETIKACKAAVEKAKGQPHDAD